MSDRSRPCLPTLRALSTAECWEHLPERGVGRVAYCYRQWPVVVPLSYVVHDGAVWVQTASYSDLALQLAGRAAAFETDGLAPDSRTGWSVLVRGRAEHVVVTPTAPATTWPDVEPLPAGLRHTTFRIPAETITGRVLEPADPSPRGAAPMR